MLLPLSVRMPTRAGLQVSLIRPPRPGILPIRRTSASTGRAARAARQNVGTTAPSSDPKVAAPLAYRGGPAKKKYIFPDRLVIYHAGTGRIVVMALIKVSCIILCAVQLASASAAQTAWDAVRLAVAGVAPVVAVTYITAPIVAAVHLRLPTIARSARPLLQRYVHALAPGDATVLVTTLGFIGKPRVSELALADLRPLEPRRRRFGLVNFCHDPGAAAKAGRARPWYYYRPVTQFGVHWSNRGVKEGWIWDALKLKVGIRPAEIEPPKKAASRHYSGPGP